jgi:hypothetical protein
VTDHYAEAERLLNLQVIQGPEAMEVIAAAQVHATLATVQRPEPSHGNHYRTIPWPPSDGLVETVASMLEATDGGDYDAIARAVLDVIGGDR